MPWEIQSMQDKTMSPLEWQSFLSSADVVWREKNKQDTRNIQNN